MFYYVVNILLPLLIVLMTCLSIDARRNEPDVVDLIKQDGYPVELHHPTTEDGYILGLHRIPHGRNETTSSVNGKKRVAVLVHCALCSSAAFVLLGPTHGLAYMLANSGYDVWLTNSRGNKYSRNHVSLSPKAPKFWKFGLHEQGIYDTATNIDYILKLTGESQVDYIGFSMGTTQFFILMSDKPEYNQKIRTMVAMGPAVFVGNSHGFVPSITPFNYLVATFGAKTEILSVPPLGMDVRGLFSAICDPNLLLLRGLCIKALIVSGGADNGNTNPKSLPFFFKYLPDTVSIRAIVHYAQLRNTGNFEKYNFGRKMNLIKYGSLYPPQYNLSMVTAPVNLFWGPSDNLASPPDVAKLKSALPNVVFNYGVPFKGFAHADFIWGMNTHSLVYKVIMERLESATQT